MIIQDSIHPSSSNILCHGYSHVSQYMKIVSNELSCWIPSWIFLFVRYPVINILITNTSMSEPNDINDVITSFFSKTWTLDRIYITLLFTHHRLPTCTFSAHSQIFRVWHVWWYIIRTSMNPLIINYIHV